MRVESSQFDISFAIAASGRARESRSPAKPATQARWEALFALL